MPDFNAILSEIKQPLWENWYITKEIGSGASSVVYRIEARRENRTDVSALKIEPITLEDVMYMDDQKKKIYLDKKRQAAVNETNIMYKLRNCPNIVAYEDETIMELQNTEGFVLLIRMEYLTCLQTMVKEKRFTNTEANVLKLAADIGNGLKDAHDRGIIHRDVKPANFFVTENNTFKLGDFNISKTSASARSFAGTQGYIAPEIYKAKQSVDNSYTAQADIYSLGICIYQLMNDYCFPFEDNCLVDEAIDRRMNGEPLPLPKNASPEFAAIILKACAYDPKDRYKTADEMINDINRLRYGTISPATQQPAPAFTDPSRSGTIYVDDDAEQPVNPFSNSTVNPFSQHDQPVSRSNPSINEPSGTVYAGGDETPSSSPAPNNSQYSDAPPKPKKKSKLPAIIAAVVVIGGLGAGGYFGFNALFNKDGSDSSESKISFDDLPGGTVEHKDSYYKFYDKHMTWREAEEFCQEQGGHLVSINSSEEQKFVVSLTKKESSIEGVWIGGYCTKDDTKTWNWTDGSDFDYKNWVSGYPDNTDQKYYYLCYVNSDELDNIAIGKWINMPNDAEGYTDSFGFVCEWN